MRGNYSSIYSSIHPSFMQEQTHILGAYDTEVNTGQTSAWSYRYFTSNE